MAPPTSHPVSDAVLRAVIESPPNIVIFALDQQYRYLAFNQNHWHTMKAIWGVEIRVGDCMLELIGREDDRVKARENFDRALAGESFSLIEAYGDEELNRRFYEDLYSPIRDANGRVIGLTLYLTDITEQRNQARELEDYRDRLEELVEQRTLEMLYAQKLESLGVLAGGIAHDFNNLLVGILGAADLALRSPTDPDRVQDHLTRIRNTAIRASELTNQMLAYAGQGPMETEVVNMNELVLEMGQLLQLSIAKTAVLVYELEDTPPIEADATQIRQVVMNLITNASEALDNRTGTITLRTGVQDPGNEQVETVFFDVEDTGVGMDEKTQARLFDPFFTTKFTGRGLGLAAVLGIVRAHNGELFVTSAPGDGSTFRVLIPHTAKQKTPEPVQSRPHREWSGEGMVLVADDEAGVRDICREVLELHGFDVLTTNDGAQCVDVYREHSDQIAVVLLDVTMPRMHGIEAAKQIRQIDPDARIVLFSGYTEPEATKRFQGERVSGFVQKPFRIDVLVTAIRDAIDH